MRELSLPPGLGVDQHAIAPDMIDLNFNSPALPEQTVLLREALKNCLARAIWRRCYAINRTPDA